MHQCRPRAPIPSHGAPLGREAATAGFTRCSPDATDIFRSSLRTDEPFVQQSMLTLHIREDVSPRYKIKIHTYHPRQRNEAFCRPHPIMSVGCALSITRITLSHLMFSPRFNKLLTTDASPANDPLSFAASKTLMPQSSQSPHLIDRESPTRISLIPSFCRRGEPCYRLLGH